MIRHDIRGKIVEMFDTFQHNELLTKQSAFYIG